MGEVTRLGDVVERLAEFDSDDTIYAVEPWTEQSEAMVAREPDGGGLPPEASEVGMKYFLEVNIVKEFIEDWLACFEARPTPPSVCQRLIGYAINGA